MVIQDLSVDGFKLADRIVGLDDIHTKVLLKKIAQFHAASLVAVDNNPELSKGVDVTVFERQRSEVTNVFTDLFYGNTLAIADFYQNEPGYEQMSKKLRKVFETFGNKIKIVCQSTKQKNLKVINHGDLWVNNFLFKYDGKDCPVDVSFVSI